MSRHLNESTESRRATSPSPPEEVDDEDFELVEDDRTRAEPETRAPQLERGARAEQHDSSDDDEEMNDDTDKPAAAHESPKKKVQLCVIMDCTGSMQAFIDNAVSAVVGTVSHMMQKYGDDTDFEVAGVLYRDFGDLVVKSIPFTTDTSRFCRILQAEKASGGSDIPEAVGSALNAATQQAWDEQCTIPPMSKDEQAAGVVRIWGDGSSPQPTGENICSRGDVTKLAILITDAPPHGIPLSTFDDHYPQGEPTYDPIEEAGVLAKKGVILHCVLANSAPVQELSTRAFYRRIAGLSNGSTVLLKEARDLIALINGTTTQQREFDDMTQELTSKMTELKTTKGMSDADAREYAWRALRADLLKREVTQVDYTSVDASEADKFFERAASLSEVREMTGSLPTRTDTEDERCDVSDYEAEAEYRGLCSGTKRPASTMYPAAPPPSPNPMCVRTSSSTISKMQLRRLATDFGVIDEE